MTPAEYSALVARTREREGDEVATAVARALAFSVIEGNDMTDSVLIYGDAHKEWLAARKDAEVKTEEAIAFARKQGRAALNDADRVYKLRVSETRNPHCHVCNLDTIPGRCTCNYRCPSTLCKGES